MATAKKAARKSKKTTTSDKDKPKIPALTPKRTPRKKTAKIIEFRPYYEARNRLARKKLKPMK